MTDERLRELERRWHETGAGSDRLNYLVACERAGVLLENLLDADDGSLVPFVRTNGESLELYGGLLSRVDEKFLQGYSGSNAVAECARRAVSGIDAQVLRESHLPNAQTDRFTRQVNQVVRCAALVGVFAHFLGEDDAIQARSVFESQMDERAIREGRDDFVPTSVYDSFRDMTDFPLERELTRVSCLALTGGHVAVALRYAGFQAIEENCELDGSSEASMCAVLASEALFLGRDARVFNRLKKRAFDVAADEPTRRYVAARIGLAALKMGVPSVAKRVVANCGDLELDELRKLYGRYAHELGPQIVERPVQNLLISDILQSDVTPLNYVRLALALGGKRKYAQAVLND